MRRERLMLLRQRLGQVLLIRDLLRNLIGPEAQPTLCTLHDDSWTQTTQDARLVVFGGIKEGNDGVVGVKEVRRACWAFALAILGRSEAEAIGAIEAEDVTEKC